MTMNVNILLSLKFLNLYQHL